MTDKKHLFQKLAEMEQSWVYLGVYCVDREVRSTRQRGYRGPETLQPQNLKIQKAVLGKDDLLGQNSWEGGKATIA